MENGQMPDFLTGKKEEDLSVNDSVLQELQDKVDHLQHLNDLVKKAEEDLKELKKAQTQYSGTEIPELLARYGLSEIKLSSGDKIIIKEDISVTIKDKFQYFKYLRNAGDDDIIKTAFEFGRLSTEDYNKVVDALDTTGLDYIGEDKVHGQTTKKYFKELLGFGLSSPKMSFAELPDWVSIYQLKKTLIK